MTAQQVSFGQMAELADPDLIDKIYETIKAHCEGKETTRAAVEMALAIALASEMGESCDAPEEILTNATAYGAFIADYAVSYLTALKRQRSMN